MTPHAIVEIPVSEVPTPQPKVRVPRPPSSPQRSAGGSSRAGGSSILNSALLENHRFKSSSKTFDLLLALTVHAVVIAGPIYAGLYFTAKLSPNEFASMMLVAPPPPPPAAAAAIVRKQTARRVFMNEGKLLAPTVVPKDVAMIKEAPVEPDAMDGVAGGVPGGVPGGQMGGVIGGVLGGIVGSVAPPAAAPVRPRLPVRVGGRIRRPQLIKQVAPSYPVLARSSHMTGDVVIDAIIDERGNVTDMKVVSGPPLFYPAALEALSQWKYEPTYLNDQAISVELIVNIAFRLDSQ
jgi:periplasmic protein TonB